MIDPTLTDARPQAPVALCAALDERVAIAADAVALNFESSDDTSVPDWIHVLPAGPVVPGRDGRSWRMQDPARVAEALAMEGADIPVDVEHAGHLLGSKGLAAPAVGWIKELEARDDGLWARVEWTDEGRRLVGGRGYRYVSPVFKFDRSSTAITRIVSVGLTNAPNLTLTALNRADAPGPTQETPPMKELLKALGLPEDATEAQAIVALNRRDEEHEVALNRAATPDPMAYVPKADHDAALNRVQELEDADKARADAAIEARIDAVVEEGKITPAARDQWLATCRKIGLDQFDELVAGMPVIGGNGGTAAKATTALNRKDGAVALNADQRRIAAELGIPEDTYAADLAAEETAR
ncbi:MAG: phage protease [Paracoccaceae bacterium]